MPLKKQPFTRFFQRQLEVLIDGFNKTPEEDVIQRLFYLQKINYYINSIDMEMGLFEWIDASAKDKQSLQAYLIAHGINPVGSFLFKGMQFAKAVSAQIETPLSTQEDEKDFDQFMQERDALLSSNLSFEESKKRFIEISYQLNLLAEKDAGLKNTLADHAQILSLAKEKLTR